MFKLRSTAVVSAILVSRRGCSRCWRRTPFSSGDVWSSEAHLSTSFFPEEHMPRSFFKERTKLFKKINLCRQLNLVNPILSYHCTNSCFFPHLLRKNCFVAYFFCVWDASRRAVRKTRSTFAAFIVAKFKINRRRCRFGKNPRIFDDSSTIRAACSLLNRRLKPKFGAGRVSTFEHRGGGF